MVAQPETLVDVGEQAARYLDLELVDVVRGLIVPFPILFDEDDVAEAFLEDVEAAAVHQIIWIRRFDRMVDDDVRLDDGQVIAYLVGNFWNHSRIASRKWGKGFHVFGSNRFGKVFQAAEKVEGRGRSHAVKGRAEVTDTFDFSDDVIKTMFDEGIQDLNDSCNWKISVITTNLTTI